MIYFNSIGYHYKNRRSFCQASKKLCHRLHGSMHWKRLWNPYQRLHKLLHERTRLWNISPDEKEMTIGAWEKRKRWWPKYRKRTKTDFCHSYPMDDYFFTLGKKTSLNCSFAFYGSHCCKKKNKKQSKVTLEKKSVFPWRHFKNTYQFWENISMKILTEYR